MNEVPYILPTHFAGKPILYRFPYTMPGELVLDNGATGIEFPETFIHASELPFEVWGMKIAASQLNGNGDPIAAPAPGINKFWRLRIQDLTKNQNMTKSGQLAATLVDDDSGNWFWRIPFTIERAEGFTVTIDNLLPAAPGNQLRAEITFRGYLIQLSPASETR